MTPAAGTRTTVAAERAGPDVSSAPIAVAVPHDGVESALRYAARATRVPGRCRHSATPDRPSGAPRCR